MAAPIDVDADTLIAAAAAVVATTTTFSQRDAYHQFCVVDPIQYQEELGDYDRQMKEALETEEARRSDLPNLTSLLMQDVSKSVQLKQRYGSGSGSSGGSQSKRQDKTQAATGPGSAVSDPIMLGGGASAADGEDMDVDEPVAAGVGLVHVINFKLAVEIYVTATSTLRNKPELRSNEALMRAARLLEDRVRLAMPLMLWPDLPWSCFSSMDGVDEHPIDSSEVGGEGYMSRCICKGCETEPTQAVHLTTSGGGGGGGGSGGGRMQHKYPFCDAHFELVSAWNGCIRRKLMEEGDDEEMFRTLYETIQGACGQIIEQMTYLNQDAFRKLESLLPAQEAADTAFIIEQWSALERPLKERAPAVRKKRKKPDSSTPDSQRPRKQAKLSFGMQIE